MLFDGPSRGDQLKVQLVRASSNPDEFRHPAEVHKFVTGPLRRSLRESGSRGYVVGIDIDRLPRSPGDKDRVFGHVWALVARAVFAGNATDGPDRVLRVCREWHRGYEEIAAFVADLEVCKVEGDQPTSVIESPTDGAFLWTLTEQIAASILAKSTKYGSSARDHVLVVTCELLPYFTDDLPEVRAAIASQPKPPEFREVWVLSLWGETIVERLWPRD